MFTLYTFYFRFIVLHAASA